MSKHSRKQKQSHFKELVAGMDKISPTYEDVLRKLRNLSLERGEWAGLPLPIEGQRLALESKSPYKAMEQAFPKREDAIFVEKKLPHGQRISNAWYSRTRRGYVHVIHESQGSSYRAFSSFLPRAPFAQKLTYLVDTLGVCPAWTMETEMTAMERLAQVTSEVQLRYYLLTGMFLETSKRSKLTYLFRRLAPTIALSSNQFGGTITPIAALCLHPVGYYRDTHGGVMCPTDDILAHLLLMRGDEVLFWRRATQNSLDSLGAGI